MAARPTPPDDPNGTQGATTEDWLDFKEQYAAWVETASDEELLDEIRAFGDVEGPLSPSQAWCHQLCDVRRRRPKKAAAKKAQPKKET